MFCFFIYILFYFEYLKLRTEKKKRCCLNNRETTFTFCIKSLLKRKKEKKDESYAFKVLLLRLSKIRFLYLIKNSLF